MRERQRVCRSDPEFRQREAEARTRRPQADPAVRATAAEAMHRRRVFELFGGHAESMRSTHVDCFYCVGMVLSNTRPLHKARDPGSIPTAGNIFFSLQALVSS